MQNQVIAEIEIEGQKIEYYSSVIIKQQFNAHHEFTIRIKYDVLEKANSFTVKESQKFIGKSVVIKLTNADTSEAAYEFRGIVCEITLEQTENFTRDLVVRGYSPTILLENGPDYTSFYQKNLKQVVQQLTSSVGQNCSVNVNLAYKSQLTYICQYKESSFHFINRLSSDFGEWFYYDGCDLYFGKPSSSPNIDITYGEDVSQVQFTLRILPMAFSNYSYLSKDDKFITYNAPQSVDGLDSYANSVLKESNKIFSEPVSSPLRQRVENKSDLESFVKKEKAAMAADLEILTGSSDNPKVCIGAIANVKFSVMNDDQTYKKEDQGKFLITSIEHHITANSKYYNTFEAIPSGLEIIPVKNIIPPIAEPQIATVKDNKDPDKMGRVRVQMLWQQKDNLMTDWLRVMTPDAGGGKGGAKNRGLVVIPESGDQVLVCFRYNDPNRPFILGSLFHGKNGGGGGSGNKSKSLTSLSGSIISLDGDAISVTDAKGNNIILDGTGKINVKSSASITLTCGSSEIKMDSGGNIDIKGTNVTITGSSKVVMQSTATFTAEGTKATIHGDAAELNGDTSVKVSGGATVDVGSPSTGIKGESSLSLQSTGTVNIEGTAMTNVKGGMVNLN
ncbi:MAG: phage baseplate assembly protein V [Bacteroidota bacterium]|nr:phage baseplate assembly protein V [Bacteroidota bacterium]